jgi:hypothetical protein
MMDHAKAAPGVVLDKVATAKEARKPSSGAKEKGREKSGC